MLYQKEDSQVLICSTRNWRQLLGGGAGSLLSSGVAFLRVHVRVDGSACGAPGVESWLAQHLALDSLLRAFSFDSNEKSHHQRPVICPGPPIQRIMGRDTGKDTCSPPPPHGSFVARSKMASSRGYDQYSPTSQFDPRQGFPKREVGAGKTAERQSGAPQGARLASQYSVRDAKALCGFVP